MKKFLIFDTECVGLYDRSIYDIAWQVVDRTGKVYDAQNYLVGEVITNPALMGASHYHKKVYTDYIPMLANGDVMMLHWDEIMAQFRAALEGVSCIAAYNMQFDVEAMSQTHGKYGDDKKITNGSFDSLCLWRFVVNAILSRPRYQQIATELGWFKTSTGNVFTNAEKAYAYISGDWGFTEDHTALSDVKIETEIFVSCMKQKTTIPYNDIHGSPWKDAQ